MNRVLKYLSFFGLILFVFILTQIDIYNLIKIVSKANLGFLILGSVLIIAEAIVKSWKLKVMVETYADYSFKDSFKTYLIGLFFGTVTPGRIGDLIKIYNLKKTTHIKTITGMGILIVERFIEMITLIILAVAGLFIVMSQVKSEMMVAALIVAAIILLALIIILMNENYTKRLGRLFYKFIIPSKFHERLKKNFDEFYQGVKKVIHNYKSLGFSILLSFCGWIIISTRAFLYALSLGIRVNYFYFLFFIPAIIMVELIPVSVMGLGTREYALILLFSTLGVSKEYAFSLSLLTFILGPIPLALAGYFISWKEHLSFEKAEENLIVE